MADPKTDVKPVEKHEPKYELKTVIGETSIVGEKFKIPVETSVFFNGLGVLGKTIEVRDSTNVHASGLTDSRGIFSFNIGGKLKEEEVTKQFRICLAGHNVETSISIVLPAADDSTVSDNDPESLILDSTNDGLGNFVVRIRVLKHGGVGLQTIVSIFYRNVLHEVSTDVRGEAIFNVPGTVAPGESFLLIATTSGIKEEAKLRIRRPNFVCNPRWSSAWWHSNNGRAFVLLLVTIILCLVCIIVGPGEPLLSDMTFRNENSGLSVTEENYNRVIQKYYPEQKNKMFAKHEPGSHWQHYLWLFVSIFSVVSVIYSALSLREEIAEGIREGIAASFHATAARADDPRYEKIAKLAGIYGAAHKSRKITTVNTEGNNSQNLKENDGHHNLATFFSIGLLSDFIVEIIPAIFRRMF